MIWEATLRVHELTESHTMIMCARDCNTLLAAVYKYCDSIPEFDSVSLTDLKLIDIEE